MSSVRKKDQSEHRFTTLDIILDMYSHTCTVISNPKFNECPDIKRRIEHEAAMIYHLCRAANEDYDNRIIDEAKVRIKAYKASVQYGNSHNLLHRLNVWYESLWEGENLMSYLKIEKKRMTLPEAKDIENALAAKEKYEAFMEYVAICDHPEILEDEETMEVEE